MGNHPSSYAIPDAHKRMYSNLLAIQSPTTRVQMIRTVLSSKEHESSARQIGIYGNLLHYVQVVESKTGPVPRLPGEDTRVASASSGGTDLAVRVSGGGGQVARKAKASEKGNERALNYFSACLRILELEEEVALTLDSLKGAYKKAVVRAHPDKGGSEQEFEAVTRAYAYLGEIIRRMNGGRSTEGNVEAPTQLTGARAKEEDKWKMVEPVALNPKNLNTKAFNEMFEKTRIPDPEEAGYGDWLKGGDGHPSSDTGGAAARFSGKFNRDIFNSTFEEESKKRGQAQTQRVAAGALVAQEMSLANRMGYATELGRTARDDYTVAANDVGLKYTDLKKAYTEYNTFSQQTAGVQLEARSIEDYRNSRKKAPDPLRDEEMAAVLEAERAAKRAEEARQLRKAQEAVQEEDYFTRMKKLVITNR